MKLYQELNNKLSIVSGARLDFAFSYSTLVAIYDKINNVCFLTSEKYSRTTSKHLNLFKNDYLRTDTKIESKTEQELNKIADDLKI